MDKTNTSQSSDTVKISLPWKWHPVKRRMLPGCELFRDGDAAMQVARKLIPLEDQRDDAEQSSDGNVKETIPCSVFGCTQTFTSLLSYENHYKSTHSHTCMSCHRTLPSAFLLDIHIQENHDPLFTLLTSRQDMYQCLVESCGHKFPDPDNRRQHMIKVHSYPANFRFHRLRAATDPLQRNKLAHSDKTVSDMDVDKLTFPASQRGISQEDKHSTSAIVASHSCTSLSGSASDKENTAAGAPSDKENTVAGAEGKEAEERMEVSEKEKQVPRRVFVHKVPQNFSFGHGVSRGFQRPPGKKKAKKKGGHWHQHGGDDSVGETTTNIENVDMKDMADALSETS